MQHKNINFEFHKSHGNIRLQRHNKKNSSPITIEITRSTITKDTNKKEEKTTIQYENRFAALFI